MKLLLVTSSGGHFSTMSGLEAFWQAHDRVWVTDLKTDTLKLRDSNERVIWLPYQGPRDVWALVRNIPPTVQILGAERPDLVISTGPSIAINFAIVAKLLGIRFIYIESVSRQRNLSLSGRLVYPLVDEFYVQWPELCRRYNRVTFAGHVQ
ncbi:PssD/Cps14F family polysaccharide biosynthesis glycosyltransferase [Acaryochloris sp. IP29b_bin.137]|uniref:PssD/Cps14F family polysaccharide biosynthesis glycosyltransferase n=1 Tax=Acaryochloris sp. IP29b_bin.137 TaxID=2969217 RepID=UPI00262BA811|nr:PssD/Cps14F family polysaccharide biosynthesis glycosyltransferase [Acaryochloris sp. IP29b_bin.137]